MQVWQVFGVKDRQSFFYWVKNMRHLKPPTLTKFLKVDKFEIDTSWMTEGIVMLTTYFKVI